MINFLLGEIHPTLEQIMLRNAAEAIEMCLMCFIPMPILFIVGITCMMLARDRPEGNLYKKVENCCLIGMIFIPLAMSASMVTYKIMGN